MKNKPDFYKELPIGLAMSLGMSEFAMEFYSEIDNDTRNKIKTYIQDCNNGNEAKDKIKTTIKNLEKHDLGFLE